MTDINIFAPPPDSTLDRIVAANRPRIIAGLRRHWWQRFTSTKRFSLLSGFTLFGAGVLVSAAVLVPQLRPGQPAFTIECHDQTGVVAASHYWGNKFAAANDSSLAQAKADPATQCQQTAQSAAASKLLVPVAQSLSQSGHKCGWIRVSTGQVYGFEGSMATGISIFSPDANADMNSCPTFDEPISLPVVGMFVACRKSALVAAAYPAGNETQAEVCAAYGQPIWSGSGR